MNYKITRSEILKMSAGRQIDALVAKQLFGLVENPDELTNKDETWFWIHPKSGVLIGESYPLRLSDKGLYSHQWERFLPSTDISAAWKALEFASSKYECSTCVGREYPFGRLTYCARFIGGKLAYDTPELKMYALAETAPLAISRLVLLAVMEAE